MGVADVIVIGAGPAGVFAAYRAAGLGAKTTLITRDEFGGMAANDGPMPDSRETASSASAGGGAREVSRRRPVLRAGRRGDRDEPRV